MKTLAFLDFGGNKQYLTLGNTAVDAQVALFLMDYPNRMRLKILAHLQVVPPGDLPDLSTRLLASGYKVTVERAFRLTPEAFDWNCPQHITPRFTGDEIALITEPLQQRIARLEAQNRALLRQLKGNSKDPQP